MWRKLSIRNKALVLLTILFVTSITIIGYLFYLFANSQTIFLLLPIPFVVAGILILLWLVFLRYFIEPMERVTQYALSLAAGKLEEDLILGNNEDDLAHIATALLQITNEIKQARQFTKSIGTGIYDVELHQNNTADKQDSLFNALIGMREQLKTISEEEKRRNWLAQGTAEFAEVLRSDDTDLKELGSNIIKGLVDYVHAGQGGLFILNSENPENLCLELVACYAYNELQFIEKSIILQEKFGEGLIGQAFIEKKTIHLTKVPEGYCNLISGIGQAPPKEILIIPLELNNKTEGVIELASFKPFRDYEITFVKRLAENITSAILTIKSNDNTKKLLREARELTRQIQAREEELKRNFEELKTTQELIEKKNALIEDQKKEIEKALAEQNEKNEMLSAQEEEMRLNMEQLVITQEKMMVAQIELDGQLNAINKSSICKIEFNLDGIVSTANQAYCNLMGYTVEELKGLHHKIFTNSDNADTQEIDLIWTNLKAGKSQAGEFKRINKNGRQVWLNAVYSPVLNQSSKPYKVVKLAFDITEAKKLLEETQSQAQILQEQEIELRQSMVELTETQAELHEKNIAVQLRAKELESKNQLITSSIQYAKNIQRAILPSEEVVRNAVQDFFVVFLPKDIVSGDFYWFSQVAGKCFFAAVDCTGHGVPGAFMSIIGNTILNEIVNVQHIYQPSKILELMHQGVRKRLRQAEATNNDGMDVAICCLENDATTPKKVSVTFAGAKRPLYYLYNKTDNAYTLEDVKELRGDRKSIGGWQNEDYRFFEEQQIYLQKDDYIFLTTDGLADNPDKNRKKFGIQKFHEVLITNLHLPRETLRNSLLTAIADHQIESEQRDDITVMGIKV